MKYVDPFKDNLVDFMMRVDFQDLLKVRDGIIITVGIKHLGFLNLVHEAAMAVGVSNNHAGFIGQSVGDDNIVNFFEQDLFSIVNIRLIVSAQVLEDFSFPFSIVGHLEVSLSNIHNILNQSKLTFPSYSLSTLNTY